jgi:hypothetical protein
MFVIKVQNAETYLWRGPESEVDAVIRKHSPLRKG